jgi:hypothetical protein
MVPGMAERDRFTSREQWNDWWRVVSPPAAGALFRVNACALWRWRPARLAPFGSRPPGRRFSWGWARHTPGREVLTGY